MTTPFDTAELWSILHTDALTKLTSFYKHVQINSLKEDRILIQLSVKSVHKRATDKQSSLVQVMV